MQPQIQHRTTLSQELGRVSPLGMLTAIPLEPLGKVILHPILRPLLDLHPIIGVLDGEIRVVDAREADHREAVLDDRHDIVHVELRQADEAQPRWQACTQLLKDAENTWSR